MLKLIFILFIVLYINLSYAQECSYQQKCELGDPDMINIHIVSHTHNDAGWLKSVDEYYTGTKKYIDKAGVQYILDSVVESLEQDPARKFSYVEGTFMYRWLTGRSDFDRHRISRLVQQGQLEILSGGWVMNDEACAHYNDIINQMALGFKIYKDAFGTCGTPRTGWQIDPFGHSAAYATLLASMGFDAMFFGRVSDSTKNSRLQDHTLEFLWHPLPRFQEIYGDRPSLANDFKDAPNGNASSDMFVSILPNVYWPPPGFCFDIFCDDDPIQDNPVEGGYNLPERVTAFLSEMERQAKNYDTNHLIVTMGNDFNYQSADNWFRNLDKLIRYVNQQRSLNQSSLQFNAFYSTPGCYSYALNRAKIGGPRAGLRRKRQARRRFMTNQLDTTLPPVYQNGWPELRAGDFFPLINAPNMIWTGFYSSRPTLKGMIRESSRFLQVCKQIDVLALLQPHRKHDIRQLDRALALAQHHDAVTGTAKQAVTYDYAQRLSLGHEECKIAIEEGLKKLSVVGKQEHLRFCPLLNISSCPFTQTHPEFDIVVYNPLAWPVDTFLTVPVRKTGLTVSDTNGTKLPYQIIPLPPSLRRIPERWAELGLESGLNQTADFKPRNDKVNVLTFPAHIPALGAARFTVRTSNSIEKNFDLKSNYANSETKFGDDIKVNSILQSSTDVLVDGNFAAEEGSESPKSDNEDYFIENEFLRLDFDPNTNHTLKLTNKKAGLTTVLDQSFGYYGGSAADSSSGAYVFRSHTLVPNNLSQYAPGTTLKILKGPVLQQARQSFAPWIDLEATLYPGVPALELTWTVGPIPINDSVAKDVVSRLRSDIRSWRERENIFYTDSNARFMVERRLTLQLDADGRRDSNFVARNYYPLTSSIFIKDQNTGGNTDDQAPRQLGILVDRAQGGTSPDKGTLEIMVHRRLLTDDNLGVGEPLNERGVDGQGLIARGKHWLVFDAPIKCDAIMTKMAQTEYLRPQVMFVAPQSNPPKIPYDGQFVSNPLPFNIHLLSLAQWERSILLRLEHIFAPGQDPILSLPVSVDLTKIFATFTVTRVTEMSLGVNQLLSEVNRFKWPVQGAVPESLENLDQNLQNKSGEATSPIIELKPLDIRTFLLKYEG